MKVPVVVPPQPQVLPKQLMQKLRKIERAVVPKQPVEWPPKSVADYPQ